MTDELGYKALFCVCISNNPVNRQSQNTVSRFDINTKGAFYNKTFDLKYTFDVNTGGHFKTKALISGLYIDLL